MKSCIAACGFRAPADQFPLSGGNGKRSGRCRDCKRVYDNQHYHNGRDKERKRLGAIDRSHRNKKALAEYLADKVCVDCDNDNLVVLEFDHRPGEDKAGNIGDIVHSYSLKRLMEEIEKCDVGCANCHRIRTWERSGGTVRVPMSLPV